MERLSLESVETVTKARSPTRSPTRSPYDGDTRRRNGNGNGSGSKLERDRSMNPAERVAALALPEQHPGTGIHTGTAAPQSMIEYPHNAHTHTHTHTHRLTTTNDSFLNASRTMMASQGSLLDDADPDVGMVARNTNTNPNPNSNTNHATHGQADHRVPPILRLAPARTNSTSIPVYPRTSMSTANTNTTATNTSNTNTSAAAARSNNHTTLPQSDAAYENLYDSHTNAQSQLQLQSHTNLHSHDNDDDGSYSDDSAVRQARENMEEIRNLHPAVLPVPEEMLPFFTSTRADSRVCGVQEPAIPVPRSSRMFRVGQAHHSAISRRPPDVVRGQLYRLDSLNDHHHNNNKRQQPILRRLQPDEMLVRCETCQRYLQLCKSAIVVQCPACGAISPAKSVN